MSGPLAGASFAAKDNFEVAGAVAAAGHPEWPRGRATATHDAVAVQRLLDAGAHLLGKTVMDPLAFGSIGRNEHYPVPRNPAAPGRRPGGSSSGSASAVAGGLVDFALGTDSACSVRLPASLCGILGMRPTHGRVPVEGVVPLSPSLDTVGWFARSAELAARIGDVLLDPVPPTPPLTRLLVPEDAWAVARPRVRAALEPRLDEVARHVGPVERMTIGEPGGALAFGHFLLRSASLQVREAWQCLGEWIERARPDSQVLTRESLRVGAESTPEQMARARADWAELRAWIRERVPAGAVLCLPTASDVAPPLELEDVRPFTIPSLMLLSIAVVGGLPQLSLPLATLESLPVGLSLVGCPGADERLLELAVTLGG